MLEIWWSSILYSDIKIKFRIFAKNSNHCSSLLNVSMCLEFQYRWRNDMYNDIEAVNVNACKICSIYDTRLSSFNLLCVHAGWMWANGRLPDGSGDCRWKHVVNDYISPPNCQYRYCIFQKYYLQKGQLMWYHKKSYSFIFFSQRPLQVQYLLKYY